MQFDKDMASPNRELFQQVRNILLSHDGMIETKKKRITTYSNAKGCICHMRTMPHGIDIGFLKGTKLEDRNRVLTGSGKVMRVMPVSKLDELILPDFVTQALALNG